MKIPPVFPGLACLLTLLLPVAFAEAPGATGVIPLDAARADQGAVISLPTKNDLPALKVDLPASRGYPGVTLVSPEGGWDLSDYAGVQVDLTNPGTEAIALTM